MKTQNSPRLLALDVLRGITIAGMIMVNNPGSWGSIYAPLKHAEWNGLSPTDLVFPFFMFIMGISTYISLRKYKFEWSKSAVWKILKRTVVIFAIGLGIAWFSLFMRTGDAMPFDRIRILGVMQRLALSYGATALIALCVKHKHIPYLIISLLAGYFLILLFGNGFAYNETNVLGIVDRAVLGVNHIYKDHGIDPEGLLSTIPAIAHVLLGFCVGRLLMEEKDITLKIQQLFLMGTILTFSGLLLNYGCPINKKIWSPTFVLTTCGLASSFLALLVYIIDVKGKKSWSRFFETFGINPLFMYVLGAVFSILLGNIKVIWAGEPISLHDFAYKVVLQPIFDNNLGSLIFALLFVSLVWACGYVLYKKKIYVKI
ncbi:membrane protein [Bacteroidia bacterium]|nr:membrane protein [Bacteroidia bacterium]